MKPTKNTWWRIHREAIFSGMIGFVVVSAVMLWPIVMSA
mgnify:FL=1|tara:strand:- start:242 stop:358 length:117 start_codon:yes stop_codon:yes gene_type:complete